MLGKTQENPKRVWILVNNSVRIVAHQLCYYLGKLGVRFIETLCAVFAIFLQVLYYSKK
jgi:hypothetical protein